MASRVMNGMNEIYLAQTAMPIRCLPAARFFAVSLFAVFLGTAMATGAAHAQEMPGAVAGGSVYDGDFLIVGVGFGSVPSYEGSDDRIVIPAAGVTGRIKGVEIGARSAGISLDFVPDRGKIGFALGPVARYRSNRTVHIKDPVVARLGKVDATVEAGIAAGVSVKGLAIAQDSLSVGADVRWDISGNGAGQVTSVSVNYLTPVSRFAVVGASVAADLVDNRYADYNFAVSSLGSAASGLPVFDAQGGLKNWAVRMFGAYDLDDNLLNGGFAVAAGVSYSRLVGSAAATPLTAERGSRDQFIFGAGLAYTF